MSRSIGKFLQIATLYVPLVFFQAQHVVLEMQKDLKEIGKLETQVDAHERVV
jgi:hypothetical protein